MPYLETDRGKLYYAVSRGPAGSSVLVLVHGAGGSRLDWSLELRRLPDATVYVLDLPGHGRSEGAGCDTVGDYARVVIGFLDAVGVDRAILAGHSMGGAIALTIALEFGERVAALVLAATGARLRVAPTILENVRTGFELTVETITRFAWAAKPPPNLVAQGREMLRQAGPDVLLRDLTACDRFDVMERLGEIEVPTLVIAGTADLLTPVKYAHYLAGHIPGARLEVFEGAGHVVMLERPEEVAGVVRAFVGGSRESDSPQAPPLSSPRDQV